MSGQYPVTATVTPIYPSGQQTATTVKNIGTKTVYLGTSNSLSAMSGYALGPGSAIGWDANKPLYAVCAVGDASTLNALDNGGGLFDAAAVASQILAQGLAGSIAQQIAISGAPPIDPLSTIYTDTVPVAANAPYNSPWINVSGYQSISFRAAEETGTVYASPLPRRIMLLWSDTSGGIPFAEESFFVGDTNNNALGSLGAFTTYQTNVKDLWVQVKWAATTRAATLRTWLTGSYKSVIRPVYTYQSAYGDVPAGWAGYGDALDRLAGIYTSSALFTNNVLYWWYPSVSAGAGYLNLAITPGSAMPAGGSFDVFVYAYSEGEVYLYAKRSLPNTAMPFDDRSPFVIPFTPLAIALRYNNASAGTWAPTASLTLTYER